MYYSTNYNSPIGSITLACDDNKNIVGVWMEGQKYFCHAISDKLIEKDDIPILNRTREWLDRYFAGEKPNIDELPLAPIGGDFRQEVWAILKQISYGQVMTYGDIAKIIARNRGKETMSAQAVGGAVGHNPISIIVPCHRVVGTNKSLAGFSGGLTRKMQLLQHEGVDISKLIVPTRGAAL